MIARWLASVLLVPSAIGAQRTGPVTLESFDDTTGWRAMPSDGVSLTLARDSGVVGSALRMSIDYNRHAGYAVARHALRLPTLPSSWAITLRVRGEIPPNTLELKLVDSTGTNVWWMRAIDLHVTPQWSELRFRPRDLSFAWGPLGGGPPRGIAAIEIAFTAGSGGRGWLALDDLTLVPLPLPVADTVRPRVIASSGDAEGVLGLEFARSPKRNQAKPPIEWRTPPGRQRLTFDFRGMRDLSGLVLDWGDSWAADLDVLASDDGTHWTTQREIRGATTERQFIHLPGLETSWLRLDLLRSIYGQPYTLRDVRILPDSAAPTASAFLEHVADASPLGTWPRVLTHQQSYWTVFGLPRDARDGLMSEDGAVDARPGGFSLEPFVVVGPERDDTLVSWADSHTTHALDGETRPMPIVTRTARDTRLEILAFAGGAANRSTFWTRYRLTNESSQKRTIGLVVAIRPVQVNPPWQFLGVPGGAATVRALAWDGARLIVNDSEAVIPSLAPRRVAMEQFDNGPAFERLFEAVPVVRGIRDTTGLASAAMEWRFPLGPRGRAEVWIAQPIAGATASNGQAALDSARSMWNAELATARVELPGSGAPLAATLQTALGDILVNARGPAIQPGTRSYRRSWIRDGSLTSSALLRLGHANDVRAFLDWFAPYVFSDGKVPCCVDARGADPVTENDADGELLYLAAEYWRMTGDSATVRKLWPVLSRTAAHLDSLRNSRRTAPYRAADSLLVFGLLPPSISHEGYSAKPAYSFWDDFWGVRGMTAAALLARIAGDEGAAHRYATAAREFRSDVVAAVSRSMSVHRMAVIPGASELGDIDPTSTTIALEPAQLIGALPDSAVQATFDLAWRNFVARRDGAAKWDAFTPYEWRLVGSLVRLGRPDRALAMAQWLMNYRRPTEWHQWAEVVWRDPRAPKFVGDMPHGWVASDFIRSTLDLIAYERERDSTLVVGAGIPYEWAHDPHGVTVTGLHTWWGVLSLSAKPMSNAIRMTIDGVAPPKGIEVHAPFGRAVRSVRVNGRPATLEHGAVIVHAPATVDFVY